MPTALDRVTLTGRFVQLEPLLPEHAAALLSAASQDRSTYAYTDVPADLTAMQHYIDKLFADHARGGVLPFAQRRVSDGQLVGCTRYLEIRWWTGGATPDEVEIGGTWLAAAAQRTTINTEAKYLLLRHAFEQLGVWRVAICTDNRNQQSRSAIERIGASFEGVLRNHRLRYNTAAPEPRDTAVYSILADEWNAIGRRLRTRLGDTE